MIIFLNKIYYQNKLHLFLFDFFFFMWLLEYLEFTCVVLHGGLHYISVGRWYSRPLWLQLPDLSVFPLCGKPVTRRPRIWVMLRFEKTGMTLLWRFLKLNPSTILQNCFHYTLNQSYFTNGELVLREVMPYHILSQLLNQDFNQISFSVLTFF